MQGLSLPQDAHAERLVISAAVLDDECLSIARDCLAPGGGEFFNPHHGSIWAALTSQAAQGAATDTATLSGKLKEQGKAGAIDALLEATSGLPRLSGTEQACKRVKDLAAIRATVKAMQLLTAEACGQLDDASAWLDSAEGTIAGATEGRFEDGEMVTADTCIAEVFAAVSERAERGGGPEGHLTGLTDLDKKMSGMGRGKLIIVGGRPGMGKSALAKDMVVGIAKKGLPVAVFSLEMPRAEWFDRVLSSESSTPYEQIRTSTMQRDGWSRMTVSAGDISALPIEISDKAAVTVEYISRWARRMKRRRGKLGAVLVDYLQLMGSATKVLSREQEVGAQSRKLKALAKELDCPVIALSQLNRKVEDREDKRPRTSDLRESGSIEQDADVILFTYRDKDAAPRVMEVDIAKQRGGTTGAVKLAWNGPLMRVSNLEVRHD